LLQVDVDQVIAADAVAPRRSRIVERYERDFLVALGRTLYSNFWCFDADAQDDSQ